MASAGRDLEIAGGRCPLRGRLRPASDKSITHRGLILGALARGTTVVRGALDAEDVTATLRCIAALGAGVVRRADRVEVTGPVAALAAGRGPPAALDCGESGTTARLLLGAAAGRGIAARFDGAPALRARPMARVLRPLAAMGARFVPAGGDALPVELLPGERLVGCLHRPSVASAQVKSALLLAGLTADGVTEVREPEPSRDHTERMLPAFAVAVERGPRFARLTGPCALAAAEIDVPGDLSAALYFGVAALLLPGSDVVLEDVGVNPTRTGALDLLRAMGAQIDLGPVREVAGEPRADLRFRHSELAGADAPPELFPRLLDDVPVLAAAAACARGRTTFHGAAELRVKESDRIATVLALARAFGAEAEAGPDRLEIRGGAIHPATAEAAGDHRVALAAAVLALAAPGVSRIRGFGAAAKSQPRFLEDLGRLLDPAAVLVSGHPEGEAGCGA